MEHMVFVAAKYNYRVIIDELIQAHGALNAVSFGRRLLVLFPGDLL